MKVEDLASLDSPLPVQCPPERPTCTPRGKHPKTTFLKLPPGAHSWPRPTSPEPPPCGLRGAAPAGPCPPSPLSWTPHQGGSATPPPQPGALLLRPRRPSPRAPAFPKGRGSASFPLSLVSLRADKERGGGDEDRTLDTPPAGRKLFRRLPRPPVRRQPALTATTQKPPGGPPVCSG